MANKTVDMRMRDTITLPTNPTLPPFPPFPKCGEIDRGLGCSTEGGTGLTTEEFLQNMAFPLLQQEPIKIEGGNVNDGDTIYITGVDCSRTVLLNVSDTKNVALDNATKQGVILTLINIYNNPRKVTFSGETVTIAYGGVVILISTGTSTDTQNNNLIWKQLSLQEALDNHIKNDKGAGTHGATVEAAASAIAVRNNSGELLANTLDTSADTVLTNKSYVDSTINGAVTPISTSLDNHIKNDKGAGTHGATVEAAASAIAVRNDSGELLANTLDTSVDTVLTNKKYVIDTITTKTAGMLTGKLVGNDLIISGVTKG